MTRTESQMRSQVVAGHSRPVTTDGIAAFAAPAPAAGHYGYTGTPTGTGPAHHSRTVVLGITGLVLVASALGAVAYVRTQQVATGTSAVAAEFVVPHGAAAALASELVAEPANLPAPEAFVPHAAQAALASDLGVVTLAAQPLPQAPHAAQAALLTGLTG